MNPASKQTIHSVGDTEFDVFFEYLNDHLADNGKGATAHFQPMPRSESRLSPDQEQSFRGGLKVPVGNPGWRRAWIALGANRQVIGHSDLRSYPDRFVAHRCQLGMGVHRDHRRRGLGSLLIAHAENWAVTHTALEWVDLQVLSLNAPAIRLYLRAGYTKIGEIPEMFKFDGQVLSNTTMTKRLPRKPNRVA